MQAIKTLRQEHEVIEKALLLLAHVAERIRKGSGIPADFAPWLIGFIRDFADGSHHQKEEQALFPLMERRGVRNAGGPLGCMLSEHELAREWTQAMESAAVMGDAVGFANAADEYVALLREHILRENVILFRMAEQCLLPGDDESLVEQYSAVADADSTHHTQAQSLEEIDEWSARLAEPRFVSERLASRRFESPVLSLR